MYSMFPYYPTWNIRYFDWLLVRISQKKVLEAQIKLDQIITDYLVFVRDGLSYTSHRKLNMKNEIKVHGTGPIATMLSSGRYEFYIDDIYSVSFWLYFLLNTSM